MRPIVYAPSAYGDAQQRLFDLYMATSCICTNEINGEYSLLIEVPIGADHSGDFARGQIITAQIDNEKEVENFRISDISADITGTMQITAEHISYEYSRMLFSPFRSVLANISPEDAFSQAWNGLSGKPYGVVPMNYRSIAGEVSGVDIAVETPQYFKAFLFDTLIKTYGGEMYWRGMTPHWCDKIQDDIWGGRPVFRAIWGINIINISTQKNENAIVPNLLYPYWGKRTDVATDYQELNSKYVVVDVDGEGEVAVDLTDQFKTRPTTTELQNAALAYIKYNYTQKPFDISYTLQLTEPESIKLGDDVYISVPPLGIADTFEVIRTEYDVLHERMVSVEVGAQKTTLSKTISNLGRN